MHVPVCPSGSRSESPIHFLVRLDCERYDVTVWELQADKTMTVGSLSLDARKENDVKGMLQQLDREAESFDCWSYERVWK